GSAENDCRFVGDPYAAGVGLHRVAAYAEGHEVDVSGGGAIATRDLYESFRVTRAGIGDCDRRQSARGINLRRQYRARSIPDHSERRISKIPRTSAGD